MKRKLLTVLTCLLLLLTAVPRANASLTGARIWDNAGLLTDQEIRELEAKTQRLMDDYGMDVVILTLDSLDGDSAQNVADTFYDNSGYGDNGLLFLLSMAEREWYISTCGDAIYAVTDYGIQCLGEEALPYLSGGYYYEAFVTFLDALPYYFQACEDGSPIDGYADYSGDYYHGDREEVVYADSSSEKPSLLISLVIGLVAATVTILIMRGSMNTKRMQHGADDYLKAGSYHLRTQQDLFLYSRVSKVRRQENSSGGSGGHGGGSSVHRNSGGRSHGGGGGKF